MSNSNRLARLAVPLSILLVLAVLAITVWQVAARSLDMDLSKIGNGQPSLVFIYDKELLASGEQTDILHSVREPLDAQLQLLIADSGTPQGRALMQQHQAGVISFVLLDGNGQLLEQRQGPLTAEQLLAMAAAAR